MLESRKSIKKNKKPNEKKSEKLRRMRAKQNYIHISCVGVRVRVVGCCFVNLFVWLGVRVRALAVSQNDFQTQF